MAVSLHEGAEAIVQALLRGRHAVLLLLREAAVGDIQGSIPQEVE